MTVSERMSVRWSYGRRSQAEQERLWDEDNPAARRPDIDSAVVDIRVT